MVNVASQCGYTAPNYEGLAQVLERYGAYGFTVLAFPCNDFGAQEPGTAAEIEAFATPRFNSSAAVLLSKVEGINRNNIWDWLRAHAPPVAGEALGAEISWNFNKFLVDTKGHVVKRYGPAIEVEAMEHDVYALLVKGIEQAAGWGHEGHAGHAATT